MLDERVKPWATRIAELSYAFQPIVQARTGHCFGYEALLRGVDRAGFPSITALFDQAYRDREMFQVERALRDLAMARFAEIPHYRSSRLFLNVDPRLFEMQDYRPAATISLVQRHGLRPEAVSFEICEQTELRLTAQTERILDDYRLAGFQVAIDDFGVGFAGLKLLYDMQPHFLKIDRYFIAGIDREDRKRSLVDNVVRYAHAIGISVIAEGVETEGEFFVCRDLGCDLVQGYLIARPTERVDALLPRYETAAGLNRRDRRYPASDERLFEAMIETVEALPSTASMAFVLDYFRRHPEQTIAPVVDPSGHPLGVLRERDLKVYVYSQYGADLLKNQSLNMKLRSFLQRCVTADVQSKAERVIELFSSNDADDGILMTRDGLYVGFLSAPALIKLAHEKNVIAAREQNPLTKLPGNTRIVEFASDALLDRDHACAFIYFDFDNFKPFNDTMGFRQGDRAILMFADLLQKQAHTDGGFAGHIGGDDFFLGVSRLARDEVVAKVRELLERFRFGAESLYDAATREAGLMVGKDRDGNERRFPLLAASAVLVWLPTDRGDPTLEEVARQISQHKLAAKSDPTKLAIVDLATPVPTSRVDLLLQSGRASPGLG
jgi:diguanylate cyclase (GGDEF)-like protein